MKRIKKYPIILVVLLLFWLAASFFCEPYNLSGQEQSWNLVPVFVQMCAGYSEKATEKPEKLYSVELKRSKSVPKTDQISSAKGVSDRKVYRLAQLMYAENGAAKDDECVLLTGIVVMKRMKSDKYPNTLEGVISQEGQYSTYQTGRIDCEPDERCLEIAEEILRFNLQKYYPDNLVFQAEFPQGSKTFKQFDHEYFCLE